MSKKLYNAVMDEKYKVKIETEKEVMMYRHIKDLCWDIQELIDKNESLESQVKNLYSTIKYKSDLIDSIKQQNTDHCVKIQYLENKLSKLT